MAGIVQKKRCSGGYTLVEAIVALGIFMIITVLSVNLLNLASRVGAKLTVEAELLENARIAMDVITAHVREAEAIKLTVDPEAKTLKELIASVRRPGGLHDYRFTYNGDLVYGQPRFHRIDFGGNELASHISNVTATIEEGILCVIITTDGNISPGVSDIARPVILRASMSLKYKDVK